MTTDNLIGYDPLAWMDGVEIGEKPVAPANNESDMAQTPIIDTEALVDFIESHDATQQDPQEDADEAAPELISHAHHDESIDTNNTQESDQDQDIDIDIEVSIESENDCQIDIDIQTNDDTVAISIETQDSPSDADSNIIDMIIEEETQIEIDSIDPIVRLNSDATIKSIEELYQQLKRVLDFHDVIEINAVEVTTIDTATLQLLVSLKKEEKRLNKTIHILSPSSRFLESARLLGLGNVLELGEV
ncbi:MAG: hypothetical protein QG557_353 [Pseudomonadota bacterium]|nr:hypothetical protein [Pseudomonadota bacterium]